jgi:CDGSH-type Zn-finger protein
MAETKKSDALNNDSMKITVSENGPYIVTGGVPLTVMEIRSDSDGYSRAWSEVKRFPLQERYALCRCGKSGNLPFCDGTHVKTGFDGTETCMNEPYLQIPEITRSPQLGLELEDCEVLCVHARFCQRAGRIWNIMEQPETPGARDTVIDQAGNCPSGRLVMIDRKTRQPIEPELEKSIAIVENPGKHEHGPLWVRGGIPVISADGKPYTVRNRVTLCHCGKSGNKPFCDGSHLQP